MGKIAKPQDWKQTVQQAQTGEELQQMLEPLTPLTREYQMAGEAIARWGKAFNSSVIRIVMNLAGASLMANPHMNPPQTRWGLKAAAQRAHSRPEEREKLVRYALMAARREALEPNEQLATMLLQTLGDTNPGERPDYQKDLLLIVDLMQDSLQQGTDRRARLCQQINRQHWQQLLKRSSNERYPLEDQAGHKVVAHPVSQVEDVQRIMTQTPTWATGREVALLASKSRPELIEPSEIREVLLDMGRENLYYLLPILQHKKPEDFPEAWEELRRQSTEELAQLAHDCDLSPAALAKMGRDTVQRLSQSKDPHIRQRAIQASGYLASLDHTEDRPQAVPQKGEDRRR